MTSLTFTNEWFGLNAKKNWEILLAILRPAKVLEVGSYEGAAVCHLIENSGNYAVEEICCIDTWSGGDEHKARGVDMSNVERRFDLNLEHMLRVNPNVKVKKIKDSSDSALASLIADGKTGYYDFIYIDGSHQAPDVLCDAILAFRLLKVGGVLGFDDYLWLYETNGERDLLNSPKLAIDSFVNIYIRKVDIINTQLSQVYLRKISE